MPPSSIPINDAAQMISAYGSHVLVCDTCALIDIIRLPMRVSNEKDIARTLAAVNKIEELVSARKVTIICPPPVSVEWHKNAPATRSELESFITEAGRAYKNIRTAAAASGEVMPSLSFPVERTAKYLYDISERILLSSIMLQNENAPSIRATSRALSCIPPASKGKVADCLIYEHTLELFSNITMGNNSLKRILLTSNSEDFFDGPKYPKPPIDTELIARGAMLCKNWNWALGEISKCS